MAIVNKLKVASGLKASYLALAVKDANTLYFCTDTNELFKGEVAYGKTVVKVLTKTQLEALESYEVGITYVILTDDKAEVYDICHSLDGSAIASFRTNISKNITDVSGKVTTLEGQMTAVEGRADALEGRATTVEGKVTTLEGEMDAVEGRAEALEGRATALESADTAINGRIDGIVAKAYTDVAYADNVVSFKNADGTVVGTINLPEEFFLDQNKTTFVNDFAWSEEAYPGSTNPNLDGEPVFVLGVKGDTATTYSFVSMKALVPSAYTVSDTATVDLTLNDYDISATIKIDPSNANAIKVTENGLMVDFAEVDFSGVIARVQGVEERATTLEGRADALEGNVSSLIGRAEALEIRATTLEEEMDAVEGRATTVEGKVTTLEGQMTAVEGRATTVEGRADALEGRATTVEGKVATLEGEMDAVEGRATTVEGKVATLETTVGNLAGADSALAERVTTLETEMDEVQDALTWGEF
jgi:predicted  nucleic acid-binding Zn-ribbon protein